MQVTKNTLLINFNKVDNQGIHLRRIQMNTKTLNSIVYFLLVVGGLTIGLSQVFGSNLVTNIFGTGTGATSTVYVLIGVAGLLGLYHLIDDTMHHSSH